ncbi:YfgM family protein [Sulfurirhabdus autotrophica]|uniref:Ancillary SecYEG translocon subunit n=1 Tax=Sulfurirhabdus autotrophica TaxID=1706046 RepID=A0A4R3Y6E8_9PROT|nr:tetratricopeptide repeat protein [Sulfurirhabdus autotrophica]TCV87397.1 putative negative regulator of RcsB-dependent stress response [Sulfurirhabdus autotrophica]
MIDLEEQEQVDALKAWWKQNGKTVIMAVSVFIVTVAGIQGWRVYQSNQARQAAAMYSQLENAEQAKDTKKIRDAAGQLIEKYASTPYAARAALISARANYESGDAKSAKAQLEWVVSHSKEAPVLDMARLRLAGILLDEKNFVESIKLLNTKHEDTYDGLYADLLGDVMVAQGKAEEARKAYSEAIQKTDEKSPFRKYIQIKLDSLGEAK